MDCKITSIKKQGRRKGFTLPELLVAMGIGAILLTVVASLSLYSGRSLAAMINYVDLDNASRGALDLMSRDIRQANRLTAYSSTSLTFEDYDGGSLTFAYNAGNNTFTKTKNGVVKTLLTECDSLEFKIYQRNPKNGTYDQYPAAAPDTCKLISVTWVCSRKIFGLKLNTESVQTAKIVIRKQ